MQYQTLSPAHITLIRAVALEMGADWYYHEISSHAHCRKLRSRTDRQFWVHFMLLQGRFQLSAGIDREFYDYGEHQFISVKADRSPAAIATEIRRRLLPGLNATLAEAHVWQARTAVRHERNGWLKNLLRQFCNSLYSRSDTQIFFDYFPPAGPRFAVKEASNSGGEYDLNLKNLTLDDVVRIAAVVCDKPRSNNEAS